MIEPVNPIDVPARASSRKNQKMAELLKDLAVFFDTGYTALRIKTADLQATGVKWADAHLARRLRAAGYNVRIRRTQQGTYFVLKK